MERGDKRLLVIHNGSGGVMAGYDNDLFVLFRLAPGDPVERMVDPSMTPEDAQLLMESMGLDQPVWTQYVYYLKNVATGNVMEARPMADDGLRYPIVT